MGERSRSSDLGGKNSDFGWRGSAGWRSSKLTNSGTGVSLSLEGVSQMHSIPPGRLLTRRIVGSLEQSRNFRPRGAKSEFRPQWEEFRPRSWTDFGAGTPPTGGLAEHAFSSWQSTPASLQSTRPLLCRARFSMETPFPFFRAPFFWDLFFFSLFFFCLFLALQRLACLKCNLEPNCKHISGSLCCSHTPARSVLDFESFAGRGPFLDGRVSGAYQVE